MNWQEPAVLVIVAAAAAYLARNLLAGEKEGGCKACPKARQTVIK